MVCEAHVDELHVHPVRARAFDEARETLHTGARELDLDGDWRVTDRQRGLVRFDAEGLILGRIGVTGWAPGVGGHATDSAPSR